jgi:hypothetical protein
MERATAAARSGLRIHDQMLGRNGIDAVTICSRRLLFIFDRLQPGGRAFARLSFSNRLDRAHRAMPVVLGSATLVSVGMLLAWDVNPTLFPARAHNILAALPLALIGISYILHKNAHQPPAKEFVKATLLAAAFLFWAANQLRELRTSSSMFSRRRTSFRITAPDH